MPNFVKIYREKGMSEQEIKSLKNKYRRENYKKGRNNYLPSEWTEHDEFSVLEKKVSDRELSKQIGHSVEAIQIKRCRLNKRLKTIRLLG